MFKNTTKSQFYTTETFLIRNGKDRSLVKVHNTAVPEGGPQIRPLQTVKYDYVEKLQMVDTWKISLKINCLPSEYRIYRATVGTAAYYRSIRGQIPKVGRRFDLCGTNESILGLTKKNPQIK